MAGKELDPVRAKAARQVIRQHPLMALFVASPVIAGIGLVWWLAGGGWAILLLIASTIAGILALTRRR
jgi:hypothetical protein